MIVCPLCEHPQATGGDCEVCGKKLSGISEAPATAQLEGLEPTSLWEPSAVQVEAVPDVEPTRHAPAIAAAQPPPDLEPTRLEEVAVVVPVEAIEGLEPTRADPLPWEERTPLMLAPTCRYCRTQANPGDVLCGRCGMRLPIFAPVAPDPLLRGSAARCPSCGSLSPADICPGCGGKVPHS